MWLSLQAQKPGDYIFASGHQCKVEDFVAAAFRAAGLDWREFVKATARTNNQQQVTNGLCGNTRKAESELGWKRIWSFETMVQDLVRAELENRSEMERADPLVKPETQ